MDFIEQLKSSVDIVQVVGERVRLRKNGPSRYTGLCPFHTEKTPSFTVHAAFQFYKCFGCGASGDVLKFVQEIEGISFYEALKLLAERHGIPMPKRAGYSDPDTRLRAALFQMHELAEEAFRKQLQSPAGEEARAYLARRGLAPETIEQFGLGYAAGGGGALVRLLERQGFNAEQLEASGLALKRQDGSFFDRFRNRLMFPIHNETGKIIGFGGRALAAGDEPKYLNSPETPIYKKSHVLYNLHRAKEAVRKAGRVVLVEGYMDVIGVFAAGVREVVASCGTSLTTDQVRIMRRFSPEIVVNFDPDAAGDRAAERSLNALLDEGMRVRIMALEGGLDPDEYCKEHGAEAYAAKLAEAKGYFYWLADRARERFGMRTADEKVAALQFLLPPLQRVNDKLERMTIANDLAGYLGVESGLVLEHFRKAAADRRDSPAPPPRDPTRPAEKILLNLLIRNPEAREPLIGELKPLAAVGQFASSRVFQTIFALHESASRITFADVHARLEENDRHLLEVLLSNDVEEASFSLEQGMQCLASLQEQEARARAAAMKARIREAERSGNLAEALRLTAELKGMEKARA